MNKYFNIYLFFVLIIAAFIGALELHLGMRQFGGWDGGQIVNVSYQEYLGYKPYQDFFTAFPVGFLIGGKLAFKYFGVRWASFVILGAIFSVVTFLLHFSILSKLKVGRAWAIAIPFTSQCLTTLPVSYWFYNQTTAISGILFLSASILLHRQPKTIFSQIIFILTSTLLMLMKVNITGFLIISILTIFLFSKLRFRIMTLFTISLLLFLFILFLTKINLISLIASYISARGRVFSLYSITNNLYFNDTREVITTLVLFLPIIFVFFLTSRYLLIKNSKKDFTILAIILVAIIAGFIGMATNNEHNMVDGSFILTGIFFLVFLTFRKERYPKHIYNIFLIGITLLSIYGLIASIGRDRIASIGYFFYQNEKLKQIQNPNLFKGLYASGLLTDVNSQINVILKIANSKNIRETQIFFGPRIDYSYAVYGIPPQKNLPIYFESVLSHSELSAQDKKWIDEFKSKKYKLGLFLHREYTFMPDDLIKYFFDNYYVYDSGYLTVHLLKNDDSLQLLKNAFDQQGFKQDSTH